MPFQAVLLSPFKKLLNFKLYFQFTAPLGDLDINFANKTAHYIKYWHFMKGTFFNTFLIKAIKISDIIFPITIYQKNQLLQYTNKKKFFPIGMGIDKNWAHGKDNKIFHLHELRKKYFLLVYFGSLGFARNIKFILEIFYKIKNLDYECKLFLIGRTTNLMEKRHLKLYCKKLKIEQDVTLTGYLGKQKLRDYLKYFDVSICAIPPNNYYKISSPTKLYESIGIGLPVIANKGIYEVETVIRLSKGGLLVDYNVNDFCDGIVKLIENKTLRQKMSKYGKQYILENYSYQKISKNIAFLFE
jgi:glycosyltransferase involved in cell wall biosynthesis